MSYASLTSTPSRVVRLAAFHTHDEAFNFASHHLRGHDAQVGEIYVGSRYGEARVETLNLVRLDHSPNNDAWSVIHESLPTAWAAPELLLEAGLY